MSTGLYTIHGAVLAPGSAQGVGVSHTGAIPGILRK
jgi:hypothetical protein